MTFKLKLIAAALAVGGAFAFGAWVTHNYYKAQLADAHEAATEMLVETVKAERKEAARLVAEEAERSRQHEQALSALRTRYSDLQEEVANAALTTHSAAVADSAGVYSCPDPTAGMDFVRLWNAATSADSGRTTPAETDSVELPQDPR